MKATLLYWHKALLQERFVVELSIHEVGKSKRYPDGIKYGLICLDSKTDKKVLFDNHHPKGPHIHIDDEEIEYDFKNEDSLVEDFKRLVLEHLGVKL